VDGSGWVRAASGGTATIIVNVEGKADSAVVTVPAVASLTVMVPTRLRVNRKYPVSTVVYLTNGRTASRAVRWTTPDPTRARVTDLGELTPLVTGPIQLSATSEGITTDVTIDGYGWETQQTATGFSASLLSDVLVAGTGAYATLKVGCEGATPFLRVTYPAATTGVVVDPYATDWYYYYETPHVSWNVVGTDLVMPNLSTSEFKGFVANMATQGTLFMHAEGMNMQWHSATFVTFDVRTVMAPVAAACPVFAP
jgi:hypothetical protein